MTKLRNHFITLLYVFWMVLPLCRSALAIDDCGLSAVRWDRQKTSIRSRNVGRSAEEETPHGRSTTNAQSDHVSIQGREGVDQQAKILEAVFGGDRLGASVINVGQGGEGVVFKGIDKDTWKAIAVKVPSRRFFRNSNELAKVRAGYQKSSEAIAAIKATNHPGARYLVAAEYVETPDGPALKMPLIEGKSLYDLEGKLSPNQMLKVVNQLAEALEAIHQAGYVHGDIKLSNVILTQEGDIRVIDFGFVYQKGDPTRKEVFGTTGHIPFRDLEEEVPIVPARDIYGALYALGSLIIPFDVLNENVSGVRIAQGARPRHSPAQAKAKRDVPSWFTHPSRSERAILTMLSSLWSGRLAFRSAGEMKKAVSSIERNAKNPDAWYQEYFGLLHRHLVAGDISREEVARIIFSDPAAARRFLNNRTFMGDRDLYNTLLAEVVSVADRPNGSEITGPEYDTAEPIPYYVGQARQQLTVQRAWEWLRSRQFLWPFRSRSAPVR
ncbi:MAG: protein kinase [Deltaproteobacteria bacterium]|nr:protein kinase [Deltaproteobacteria bacterium]